MTAARKGQPAAHGNNGRKLHHCIKLMDSAGLAWLVLLGLGVLVLSRICLRQLWFQPRTIDHESPTHFFVGFGARAEEPLYKKYCEAHVCKAIRLDETDPASFASLHRVPIINAMRDLFDALNDARKQLAHIPDRLKPWRCDILTQIGKQVSIYAYMCSWFAIAKKRYQIAEIAFLSTATPSFAATELNLPTCFIQHGLLKSFANIPNFTRVETLTQDEALLIRRALPTAQITVREPVFIFAHPSFLQKTVLIASQNFSERGKIPDTLVSLAESLVRCDFEVVVRPYPGEDLTYWKQTSIFDRIKLSSDSRSFEEDLHRLKPRLVVSVQSTCLAHALSSNIIPVVTGSAEDDESVCEIAYPLYRRCLRWPQEENTVTEVLTDDGIYCDTLVRLQA